MRFIAVLFALVASSPGAFAAPPAESLESAATSLAAPLTSALLASTTDTVRVAFAVHTDSGASPAASALEEFLIKGLLSAPHPLTIVTEVDKADYTLAAQVIDVEGSRVVSVRAIERRTSTVKFSEQRVVYTAQPANASAAKDKPSQPDEARRTAAVSAGIALRGGDISWRVGAALRPATSPWEIAAAAGSYKHVSTELIGPRSLPATSTFNVSYLRAEMAYILKLDRIRTWDGESLFYFPGHLRAAAGLGGYLIDENDLMLSLTPSEPDQTNHRSIFRAAPHVAAGVTREIGSRLEFTVGGEYVFSSVPYGTGSFTLGGVGMDVLLSYKFH